MHYAINFLRQLNVSHQTYMKIWAVLAVICFYKMIRDRDEGVGSWFYAFLFCLFVAVCIALSTYT